MQFQQERIALFMNKNKFHNMLLKFQPSQEKKKTMNCILTIHKNKLFLFNYVKLYKL